MSLKRYMKEAMVGWDSRNPLNMSSDTISERIIGIHDSLAKRQDVDSLYNAVSKIVEKATNVGDFLGAKHCKTVASIEDKVPQPTFMPSFSTVKEIACQALEWKASKGVKILNMISQQMTCQSFNPNTAHKTIVEILKKLETYTWDAKAVIALSAFSLNVGESLRLFLMEATTKDSLFSFEATEKDKPTKLPDQLNESGNLALRMIRKIIDLEKKIADKNVIVPGFSAVKREVFTYWAIFALAFASQTQAEWNVPGVLTRLRAVSLELDDALKKLERHEVETTDYNWAIGVVRTPAGIRDLLIALIFRKKVAQLDVIFDMSTKTYVEEELLVNYNFLLFFSSLDNIEHEISNLKEIHDDLKKEKKKQQHKILWIPVVDKWTDETRNKVEEIKALMPPWYVVQCCEPRSLRILREEFHYNGKPIVVVTNPRGEIVHTNAMHMIIVWGIKAFPFRAKDEKGLSENWKWLWFQTSKFQPMVDEWVNKGRYIFLYGGVDGSVTEMLANQLQVMKRDTIWEQANASIEFLNLGNVDANPKFWGNINNLFLSHVSNDDCEKDPLIEDIEMLLSMKKEKGWVLVSNGKNVLAIIPDPLATIVVEDYKEWTKSMPKQRFDEGFVEYYKKHCSKVPDKCTFLEVDNIRSKVPVNLPCPCCGRKMDIKPITYICCHGKDPTAVPVQKQKTM